MKNAYERAKLTETLMDALCEYAGGPEYVAVVDEIRLPAWGGMSLKMRFDALTRTDTSTFTVVMNDVEYRVDIRQVQGSKALASAPED